MKGNNIDTDNIMYIGSNNYLKSMFHIFYQSNDMQ